MSHILDPITRRQVDNAAAELHDEFAGVFSQETIARYIEESTDLLSTARITAFVPLLIHRFSRERLQALAQAQGKIEKLSLRCCSYVSTTRAAARWPPAS